MERDKRQYNQGFSFGISPVFTEFEDMTKCGKKFRSQAFQNGFNRGRSTYIQLNGELTDGLPNIILTPKIAENFIILGLIEEPLQISKRFSSYQISVIHSYYQKGLAQKDNIFFVNLQRLLHDFGVNYKL